MLVMVSKRVDVFDSTKGDKIEKIIQNLNNAGGNVNVGSGVKPDDVDRQQTIVDEYLEVLKLRRQIASTLFNKYLIELLKERDNVDPAHIEKMASLIGLYLGIGDRWSNETLKSALGNEIGIYGGFVTKLYPEFLGDPVANYERSLSIGTKDDTSVLISNLLQLLGINLNPETIDKLTKLLKDRVSNK